MMGIFPTIPDTRPQAEVLDGTSADSLVGARIHPQDKKKRVTKSGLLRILGPLS